MSLVVLRLTSAQQSALECALLDDEDTPVVLSAWDGRGALTLDAANVGALVRELIDLTNSEDDIAEDRTRDPAERSGARGARMALQNLRAATAGRCGVTVRGMTRQGNPKDSKWRSTPNAARVNKNVMLTLPPDEREKLDRLAKAWSCPRSVAVARLVREAEEPA